MAFLLSLIPATVLTVVGYFVLYASARAEGGVRKFGRYLSAWIFLIAGLSILGGLLVSTIGPPDAMRGMMGMTQHMERMESMEQEQLEILRELQRE